MHRYSQERKIAAGLDAPFAFRTKDGYPSESPSLTCYWPAPTGTKTYALAPVRTPDKIVDVSDDGRDITIECEDRPAGLLRGLVLELGGYLWIDGGAVYQAPHRVVQIVSQTGPVDGITTVVLRLAEPIRDGARPVVSYSGAEGSITVLDASAATDGYAFELYGNAYEWLDGGSSGNNIDISGAPSNATLASRIAAKLNAEGNGLVASAVGAVVSIEGLGDGAIELIDPPDGVLSAVSLTGAVDDGQWLARWTVYVGTIPTADSGSARLRNVKWEVPWLQKTGADLPGVQRRHRGFLHVVPSPFDTGLDDADLYALVPGWAALVPDRAGSYAEQRWEAEEELIARLRPRCGSGRCEDDTFAEQFRRVHALFTAALIRRWHATLGYTGAAESAESLHQQALEALDLALGCVTWLDANGNNVVDTGETGVARAGVDIVYATCFDDDAVTQAEVVSRRAGRYDDR